MTTDTKTDEDKPDSVTGDRKETVTPGRGILDFNVEDLQEIKLNGPDAVTRRDLMSPYVWTTDNGHSGRN